MEIIQMIGTNAYANYCAAYNDCAPADLPRFSNMRDVLEHAAALAAEAGDTVEGAIRIARYKELQQVILAHVSMAR